MEMSGENTAAPTTPEERFFGLSHQHGEEEPTTPDSPDGEGAEVIIDDKSGEVEATTAEPQPPEAGPSEEDLAEMSEKVQKRINKLTWQKNEEARRAVRAESEREAAIAAARAINHKNQQYERIMADGEAALIRNIKERADYAMQAARQNYIKAQEEDDVEAVVKAQEEFNRAQFEQQAAEKEEAAYKYRMQQPPIHQPQPQFQQPMQQPPMDDGEAPPPSAESLAWHKKNPWFHDPEQDEMTAIAYAAHANAVKSGVAPDTKEYYDMIDERVHKHFPEYFRDADSGSASASRKPSTVVAPGTRSTGTKPRKVKLEPSEVWVAKQLGLSNEQYALQILKERKQ
jgi:hypothetical protein